MRPRYSMVLTVWVGLWLVVGFRPAAAQQAPPSGSRGAPVSVADRAAAQALFDEGRALMAEERYEEACPKFAESQRLDPRSGTQLNLADCHEHVGKTASAWINFLEAAAAARKIGQAKRAAEAQQRAEALEPKLTRIEIVIPSPVDGLEVWRDDNPVRRGQWGTAVPVDPGEHRVRAAAPGYEPWTQTVTVTEPGAVQTVTIPELEPAPETAPPKPPARTPPPAGATLPAEEPADGTVQLVMAGIAGGIGVAGVVVGAIFGTTAISKNDDSEAFCPDSPTRCTAEGVALRDEAITAGHTSTVAFVIGAVGLVTGLVLWLTAPSAEADAQSDPEQAASSAADLQLWPIVNLGQTAGTAQQDHTGGLVVRGRW